MVISAQMIATALALFVALGIIFIGIGVSGAVERKTGLSSAR